MNKYMSKKSKDVILPAKNTNLWGAPQHCTGLAICVIYVINVIKVIYVIKVINVIYVYANLHQFM
jgi:hypothetical protein